MNGADWRQQQELEQEREELTIAALRRIDNGTASHDDVVFLAQELGINLKQLEAA